MAVKIDGLSDAIAAALADYRQEVTDDIKASAKNSARACVAELRAASPELTGSYKDGWAVITAHESSLDIRLQVHNKTDPQLTHLLEDGHANVDGGRTPGQPHIGPAAKKAAELLEKDVKIKVGRK